MKREEYHSLLDNVFKSIEDAIFAVDRDLVVTETNESAKTSDCGVDGESIDKELNSPGFGCEREYQALDEIIERAQSIKARRFEFKPKENLFKTVNLPAYPLIDPRGLCTGAVMTCREKARDFSERRSLYNLVGKSRQMQRIYSLIEKLANVESNVLISGESGTGKELVAEALHHLGTRKNRHLVKVNCSALSESLLESELFGHIRGAFTGAVHDKVGRFQKADGGTLFLDEVGDLSPKVQVTLLRVLEEKTN